MSPIKASAAALLAIALTGCTASTPAATPAPTVAAASPTAAPTIAPTSTPAPTPAASPTANPLAVPAIPAPVAVTLDSKTTVLAVMDVINPTCTTRPQCVDSIPAIAALLKKARDAKVPVVFTAIAPNPIVPQVAPQGDEPTFTRAGVADVFSQPGTPTFDELLKARKAATVLMVGTRSNGVILYSAFEANIRGYTVAVAVDGISGAAPIENNLTMWQLLNQPGFANADNKPLAEKLVTLTRGDLVTFR